MITPKCLTHAAIYAVALILSCSVASAGAGGGVPVSVEFRTMALSSNLPQVQIYNGGRYQNVDTRFMASSVAYSRYSGPAVMPLYLPGAPAANGQPQMNIVGEVTFPTANGRFIVLLTSNGDGKVSGAAVPDSTSNFPWGSSRIINTSSMSLIVTCNDIKEFDLKPLESRVIPLGRDGKQFNIHVYYKRDGLLIELTNNVFGAEPTARNSVFLVLLNASELRREPESLPRVEIFGMLEDSARRNDRSGRDTQ